MATIKQDRIYLEAILWKQKPNKDGRLAVKIRITQGLKKNYLSLVIDGKKLFLDPAVNKGDENKKLDALDVIMGRGSRKVRGAELDLQRKINAVIVEAERIKNEITRNGKEAFHFADFKRAFLGEEIKGGFFFWFQKYLDILKRENRVGSYNSYNNALQAFKKFQANKEVFPEEITPELLRKFEGYLLTKGASQRKVQTGVNETTVAIYMRSIRAVYYFIADEYPALLERCPFSKKQNDRKRYRIRTTSNKKGDVLTREQVAKLIQTATAPGMPDHEAKLYWLFSYYCRGINMKDIALMKFKNIEGGILHFVREKTKGTVSEGAPIQFYLRPEALRIIEELGNKALIPDAYVFPILDSSITDPFRMTAIIKQKTKWINGWLKQLCEKSNLPVITTYWARHTWTTHAVHSDVDIRLVSESLGHRSLRTTEVYIKKHNLQAHLEVDKKLDAFMKVAS